MTQISIPESITLKIHGVAVFDKKVEILRRIGPVVHKGWGPFKREYLKTEAQELKEISLLELKGLEVQIPTDSFTNRITQDAGVADFHSLNDFLINSRFSEYLESLIESGEWDIFSCEELYPLPPYENNVWGGFLEDGEFLDLSSVEKRKAEYCKSGSHFDSEEEFLASISPENFRLVLLETFFVDANDRRVPDELIKEWDVSCHGNALVRDGPYQSYPPHFVSFSSGHRLDVEVSYSDPATNSTVVLDEGELFDAVMGDQ